MESSAQSLIRSISMIGSISVANGFRRTGMWKSLKHAWTNLKERWRDLKERQKEHRGEIKADYTDRMKKLWSE